MEQVRLAGRPLEHFHIAAFFRTREEEYETLKQCIVDGIQAGEKAVHICDPELRHDHAHRLEGMGVPVGNCASVGQLEVLGWHEAYLKQGAFDAETMLALVEEVVETSRAQGFERVRFMGHMEWVLQDVPGVEQLIDYETRVTEVLNRCQQPAICVYDLNRYSGREVMDIMRVHPVVLVDGRLTHNPLYVEPNEILARNRA